jgi:tripartite-type tricarboxylate transporter receptor subunit TctC
MAGVKRSLRAVIWDSHLRPAQQLRLLDQDLLRTLFKGDNMNRRQFHLHTVALTAAGLSGQLALAQTFPSKPIRLVVPFPPGGGVDLVGRILSQRLSEVLKQQVVVENRAGASGAIGADIIAKAPADGHSLLLASPAEVMVGPISGQKTPYNPEKDFLPIALVGETPLVIVAHPSLPVNNVSELIAYAKSRPGKLSYATPGNGSSQHFAGEALKASAGVFMVHIPYRGAAPALNDVLGNQIPLGIVGMPPALSHAKSGKLKILAVTTKKKSSQLPDTPSVAELQGMQNYAFTNWMCLYAPSGMPKPIADQLSAEVSKILQDSAVRERLLAAGVEPMGLTGMALTGFLSLERNNYSKASKQFGIRFQES